MSDKLTSSKPYLVRAIYEWIVDNNCTPYIAVDTTYNDINVPEQYIENDRITLDISTMSTEELLIDNRYLTCKASFDGVSHDICIPLIAIEAIYAAENNHGMWFPKEEEDAEDSPETSTHIQTEAKVNKFRVVTGDKV